MDSFTYLLICGDGTLYCGWTNDLEKRLAAHNAGTASKYTRSRLPVELIYAERHDTKQEAMSCEYRIKRLPRHQKLQLIDSDSNILILSSNKHDKTPAE